MRTLVLGTLVLLVACDVGSVGTMQGATPDASGSGSGSGSADAAVGGAQSVTATFTTTPSVGGGAYAPKNIVAVWVEDSSGTFVKTIGRWAGVREGSLVGWQQKSGGDADAVSGATRQNHTTALTVTWDLRNKSNVVVSDGTYTIRMELADENATAQNQNNEATFTFVKGASPQSQSALSNGGFTNVSIEFVP